MILDPLATCMILATISSFDQCCMRTATSLASDHAFHSTAPLPESTSTTIFRLVDSRTRNRVPLMRTITRQT